MKNAVIGSTLLVVVLMAGPYFLSDSEDVEEVANIVTSLESDQIIEEDNVEIIDSKPVALASASQSVQESTRVEEKSKSISQETEEGPKRLIIPSIGVDAHIEKMGVTSTGAMDAPAGPDNAGWYKYGVEPGKIGSAVIDGHSGWRDNIPAIFDNLGKVRVGDKIYIEGSDGNTVTFVVRELREYGYNDNAYEIFNSNDGKAHLNLITCSGAWNDIAKSSLKRLVVFADKIN